MLTAEMRRIVQNALAEDIGSGDVTSVPIIAADTALHGVFVAKAAGVVAGLEVAGEAFHQVDEGTIYTPLLPEGASIRAGDLLARVSSAGPGLLIAERTALNFLQRMSGIATATRRYVDAVIGTRACILDTRKTAPGLRVLDKWAVALGGGQNHRIGLYDMVLIKDNHIAAARGVTPAVERARRAHPELAIEVEVTSLAQLDEALGLGVQRIMLDNMDLAAMRQAVERTAGRAELEASGGITLDTVAEVAATGVDLISVGALTHSVKALDISLEITLAPTAGR